MLVGMEPADRARVAEELRRYIVDLRVLLEEAARTGAGLAIDEVLSLVEGLHQQVVILKIHGVIDEHGAGPYAIDDLAVLIGEDPLAVRLAMDDMAGTGAADRREDSPD